MALWIQIKSVGAELTEAETCLRLVGKMVVAIQSVFEQFLYQGGKIIYKGFVLEETKYISFHFVCVRMWR